MKAERLPSGNYRCKVSIGKDKTGKRIYKSFTGPSRRKVEADAARFALVNRTDASSTVRMAVDAFITGREDVLSPSTTVGYRSIERRLNDRFPAFMGKPVYSVTGDDLQKVVNELSRTCSPKTVSNVKMMICSALKHAGAVVDSPKMPQKKRADLHIPSDQTVRQVIQAAQGTPLLVPILLAAFGPLRRGEICALTMNDIDGCVIHVSKDMVKADDGTWQIKPPKTYTSDRYVTMPIEVIEVINAQGLYPYRPDNITKRFRELLLREGIEPFRFHDLRHWCCSYLHAIGVPDVYIMQRSGHATTAILRQIYTHTLQDQSKAETARIVESFRGTFRGTEVPKTLPNVPK